MRTGRYSTVALGPTAAQAEPLQATITRRFPDPIQTVGQALDAVLRGSGYRLAPAYSADPAMGILRNLPLPEAHRALGPLSLKTILTTLAGPSYRLVTDPVHRLVSFELETPYRALAASIVTARSAACPSPAKAQPRRRDLTVTYERRCYLLAGDKVCCAETPPAAPSMPSADRQTADPFQETWMHGFNSK